MNAAFSSSVVAGHAAGVASWAPLADRGPRATTLSNATATTQITTRVRCIRVLPPLGAAATATARRHHTASRSGAGPRPSQPLNMKRRRGRNAGDDGEALRLPPDVDECGIDVELCCGVVSGGVVGGAAAGLACPARAFGICLAAGVPVTECGIEGRDALAGCTLFAL